MIRGVLKFFKESRIAFEEHMFHIFMFNMQPDKQISEVIKQIKTVLNYQIMFLFFGRV